MEKVIEITTKQEKLLEVAPQLAEWIQQEQENQPYSLNLVELLHANENAHSRILATLLSYKKQNVYPLLNSFITHCRKLSIELNSPNIDVEHTTSLGRRIDILIYQSQPREYAIIIENKCNGADDQDGQIDDYVEYVVNKWNIKPIVIYLTKDGNKSVPLLKDETQRTLNMKGSEDCQSNLIELNYKDNIYPWIQQLLSLENLNEEHLLKSALVQYADYLNKFLNINKGQNQQNMIAETKNQLEIGSLSQAIEYKQNLNNLQSNLDNLIQEYVNQIAKNEILTPLKTWLNENYPELTIEEGTSSFKHNQFSLYIKKKESSCKWGIGIETQNGKVFYGVFVLESADETTRKTIQEKLGTGWNHSPWWPCYKWSEFDVFKLSDKYWVSIDSKDIQPLNKIRAIIKEIYSKITQ